MRYKPSLDSHATKMRKEPSRAERALWKMLRGRRFEDLKFRRQHQIDCYIADFACISENSSSKWTVLHTICPSK